MATKAKHLALSAGNNIDASGNVDSDTFDGLDSTQFLRSDTSDTMTGDLSVSGNLLVGTASLPTGGGILTASSSADETKVNIVNTGASGRHYWIGSTNTSSGAVGGGKLAIYDQTGNATRLAIDSSGNVGFGTSSPDTYLNSQGKIFVTGSSPNWATIQSRGDGPSGAGNGVSYGGSYLSNPINGARIFVAASGGSGQQGQILFYTKNLDDNSTPPAERMRIDTSGNLLVGKTAEGVGTVGVQLRPDGFVGATRNNGIPMYLQRQSADGEILRFQRDNTGVGNVSVTTAGTTYNTTSDRRLKDNITTITDGKEKLLAMNPVTHTWKADSDAPAVHGFIAQEMQSIVPEAVSGDLDSDEMMSMDYGRITPVIVAALQDALKEIEELKTRINELEAK